MKRIAPCVKEHTSLNLTKENRITIFSKTFIYATGNLLDTAYCPALYNGESG